MSAGGDMRPAQALCVGRAGEAATKPILNDRMKSLQWHARDRDQVLANSAHPLQDTPGSGGCQASTLLTTRRAPQGTPSLTSHELARRNSSANFAVARRTGPAAYRGTNHDSRDDPAGVKLDDRH